MKAQRLTGRQALKQNGDGFGGSITYDIGAGFSVGGAISSSKRTTDQNNSSFAIKNDAGVQTGTSEIYGSGDRAETYSGGVKYDANNIYLAAQYTQTYNATRFGGSPNAGVYGYADKAQNFEVVAQYQFDFGLRPSIAYLQSKGKNIDNGVAGGNYGDQDLLKYVDVVRLTTSTKTCLPTLTTKSTCWTKTTSPLQPVSLPITSLHWV
ncbi:Porin OmpC [Kluyvera cryocrescens]|uniref:Porin OmpC n=1 Tax=Kluyvera cryocrescens TaxID=580 RepID=A0A485C2L9_KLUCR|nr:Porin OmpC [Kluyvera cryocrescens]